MDPETALELVKQGATLLLLDVPQFTLLGIDTQVFKVGPVFKGIKMIPPGPHFVFYSSSSRDGNDFAPITGFFVDAGPSQVIVRKWDQQEERLVRVAEDEEARYHQAVRSLEFDRHLGPYTLSRYGEWKRLSNYLTKSVIERIEPIGGDITMASESDTVRSNSKTMMEKTLDEQLMTSKFSTHMPAEKAERKGCFYTPIPHVIKRKGVNVNELTSLNLDKTQLLERVLMKDYQGSEDLLLGELQFTFVAFLMGQSLEAFLQWKSLVSLLLGCTEAPFRTRSQLFTKFIKVLYYQLKYGLQKDGTESNGTGVGALALLDESWFSADSFLYQLCKEFVLLVEDASVIDGDLLLWTRNLRELLEKCLGWQFQPNFVAAQGMLFDEDDEFAPVVEMLDNNEASAT